MYRIKAIEAPLEQNLGDFSLYLQQNGIPNRVYEEAGKQVLWVIEEGHVQSAQNAYAALCSGELRLQREKLPQSQSQTQSLLSKLALAPRYAVILSLILLSFCGYLLPYFDMQYSYISLLTFQDFDVGQGKLIFTPAGQSFAAGEYWRGITPIFLHFGEMHFIFNSLWLWELGRRIEVLQGHVRVLAVVALVGVGSNIFQYVYKSETLFGGMSGVIYGLLGYCWMWDKCHQRPVFDLAPGIVGFMLFWLVFCMTGLLDFVGIGVANAAHLSGLVIGMLMGAWGGLIARSSSSAR